MMNKGDLCLVTGVSGYLASWVAKNLIEQGFRVRGTVRSMSDTERLKTLETLLPGIELVAADLRAEEGWDAAVSGCLWIFHIASPQAVKTETDRTGGAVSGTKHLLRAAFASETVRKVVLTSSEAAVAYGHPRSKNRFDETDWTDLNGLKSGPTADYFRSKTIAERLAWDWASDASRNPRHIPLATINPSLILGPSLVPWGRFSVDTLRNIVDGKSALMVDLDMRVVDVRDCANMHIALMRNPTANGRRHLSFGATGKMVDLALSIRRDFSDIGFNPSTRMLPNWALRAAAYVSGEAASIASHIGNPMAYVPQHPEVYAYEHQTIRGIVADTMRSMLAHGWIKPVVSTLEQRVA